MTVLKVDRPDRSDRRRKGKDDDLDAIDAARIAETNRRTTTPKSKDVAVESLRSLRAARTHSAGEQRSALQLVRMTIISAPDELRAQVRNLTRMQLIRLLPAWRPDVANATAPMTAYRMSLKSLARRYLELTDAIADQGELINPIGKALAPQLLERVGIGIEVAGQMLVPAGDNSVRTRRGSKRVRLREQRRGRGTMRARRTRYSALRPVLPHRSGLGLSTGTPSRRRYAGFRGDIGDCVTDAKTVRNLSTDRVWIRLGHCDLLRITLPHLSYRWFTFRGTHQWHAVQLNYRCESRHAPEVHARRRRPMRRRADQVPHPSCVRLRRGRGVHRRERVGCTADFTEGLGARRLPPCYRTDHRPTRPPLDTSTPRAHK